MLFRLMLFYCFQCYEHDDEEQNLWRNTMALIMMFVADVVVGVVLLLATSYSYLQLHLYCC
jgi:hypothetical protein